jgi:hypothetical protein
VVWVGGEIVSSTAFRIWVDRTFSPAPKPEPEQEDR